MVSSTTSALDQFDNIVFEGSGQKYAVVNGSGTTVIVAAVTGMKIRLLAGIFNSTDGSTPPVLNLQTKPSGTAVSLTGEMSAQNNVNIVFPFNPAGWMESGTGEIFQMTTTGTFTGCVVYEEVASE